jgi:hypothetical protein
MDGHTTKPNTVCHMRHHLDVDLSRPEGPDNLTSWSAAQDGMLAVGVSSRSNSREAACCISGHDRPKTDTEALCWSSFDWTPGKETSTASPIVPGGAGPRLDHEQISGQFQDYSRHKSTRQRHRPARAFAHSFVDRFEPDLEPGSGSLLSSAKQSSFESKPAFSAEMQFADQQDEVEHLATPVGCRTSHGTPAFGRLNRHNSARSSEFPSRNDTAIGTMSFEGHMPLF